MPREEPIKWAYDSIEFAVTAVTDYDLKTNQSGAFDNVKVATDILIRTDSDINFKFNSSSNATVSLTAPENALTFNSLKVSNIFITNTVGTATLKIFMMGR